MRSAPLQIRFGRPIGNRLLTCLELSSEQDDSINRNRVFRGLAARGKSSTGWFYGFKRHIAINHFDSIDPITNVRKNMKPVDRSAFDQAIRAKSNPVPCRE